MDFFKNNDFGHIRVGNFNLTINKKISEGGFGFVYEVTDARSGQKYALKQVNIQS